MAKRMVDFSIAIEAGLPSDPPIMIPRIDYLDHSQGKEGLKRKTICCHGIFQPAIPPLNDDITRFTSVDLN